MSHGDANLRRWPEFLFGLSVVIGLVCLAATYIIISVGNSYGPVATRLLVLLNFSSENTAGVWWAGMMYATCALFCLDAYLLEKGTEQHRSALAWRAIGIVLVILSFDEIGSLHERLPDIFPWGKLLALVPYGAIVGGLLAYGLGTLFLDPRTRRKAIALGIPFAILLSVPVQEKLFLERHDGWLGLHPAIRTTLEEGIETFCALAILRVVLTNVVRLRMPGGGSPTPAFDVPSLARRRLLIVAALVAPLLAYWSFATGDEHAGSPVAWFAAILCLFAAIVHAHPWLKVLQPLPWRRWALVLTSGAMSVAAVADVSSHYWLKAMLLGMLLIICGSLENASDVPPSLRWGAVGAGVAIVVISAAHPSGIVTNLGIAASGWIAYLLPRPASLPRPA